MLIVNKGLAIIRCSRYQYVIKKGSMSNYSFDIIDETKSGIIEQIFEKISYPTTEEQLIEQLKTTCGVKEDEVIDYIDKLKAIGVLQNKSENVKAKICLLTDYETNKIVSKKLAGSGFTVKTIVTKDIVTDIFDVKGERVLADDKVKDLISKNDFLVLVSKNFKPNLFYKMNALCLELNKRMIIAYLDGAEGLIIPIVNANKTGCYNDFEILRESSFHNLIHYQVFKEKCIEENGINMEYDPLHFDILTSQTVLILKHIISNSYINSYCYSFDFERMVNSKIRMLKFPKCPSCQSDKNLTHPFI